MDNQTTPPSDEISMKIVAMPMLAPPKPRTYTQVVQKAEMVSLDQTRQAVSDLIDVLNVRLPLIDGTLDYMRERIVALETELAASRIAAAASIQTTESSAPKVSKKG